MNYVGKLFSNVRGFYNEINPATLTGAIDVVVIRQCDGTFTTSPWHVRFGKMGVIRARQKVVDIEINGEPADLHMKLGEAGEAFFVQEAEDTAEVPAYLATSPITPVLREMEQGLAELKQVSYATTTTQDDPVTPVVEHCGTMVMMENGNVVVSGIPPSASTNTLVEVDDRQYFSDSDIAGSSTSRRRRQRVTVATQTHITSSDIDSARCEARPATPPGEWYAGLSTAEPSTVSFESAQSVLQPAEYFVTASASARSCPPSRTLLHRVPKPPAADSNKSETAAAVGVQTTDDGAADAGAEDYLFEMDLSDDETVLPKVSSSSDISTLGRCVSMPVIGHSETFDEMTDSWAASQYATTTMHNYTPNTSPFGSRPSSPQSDSGVMTVSHDAMSQTHLTGDRIMLIDDVKWRWGEFPETASSSAQLNRISLKNDKFLCSLKTPLVEEEKNCRCLQTEAIKESIVVSALEKVVISDPVTTSKLPGTETKAADASVSKEAADVHELVSIVVETCPVTEKPAKSKKEPKKAVPHEKEGIYLDDLSHDEPELAALYLYSHKSSPAPQRGNIVKDEDSESGRGASLPQSPITVETDSHEHDKKPPAPLEMISASMSLCGPLDDQDARISDDKFNAHLVTFEALCENPGILSDATLVVRVGDKYYNWAIAAPLIMSHAVFHKALTDSSLSRLVSQHLPKKDPVPKRGWRFWRRVDASTTTTTSVPAGPEKDSVTPPSSHPSSPPDTPQKVKGISKTSADMALSSDDEADNVPGAGSLSHVGLESHSSLNADMTGVALMMKEKCRKSLKLTSDEIARLKLKDGANEATFSVTTQYQGTTRCQCNIYLWNWDDRIIVSDIDGTITKSDVLGQVLPMIGSMLPLINSDWSQAGIAQLYQMIHRNGYKFLYLSARAIGQSRLTRDYLRSVKQSDISLPDGPLLLSPSSLMSAFHKEVIERKPEQFKISCLRDISALFPPSLNPFCAGFGNKINDVWAYREVGIPISRIFTVNHKGELRMEMTQAFLSSYTRLGDLVDHMFPPLHPCDDCSVESVSMLPAANQYSSFTYWRPTLPDLDAELADFIKARDAEKNANADAKKGAGKKTAVVTATGTKNKTTSTKVDSKTSK